MLNFRRQVRISAAIISCLLLRLPPVRAAEPRPPAVLLNGHNVTTSGPRHKTPLQVFGRELRLRNWPVDLWGIQLPDWPQATAAPAAFPMLVKPFCEHGVNALGITLQSPGDSKRFFSPDGSLPDRNKAQFSTFCKLSVDHWLIPVVSIFSADRTRWLASADAYRKAAQTTAGLVGKRRAVILVAGDIFGDGEWSADCPYPMQDPSALAELCRLMRAANPDALLAIPAGVFKSSPAD